MTYKNVSRKHLQWWVAEYRVGRGWMGLRMEDGGMRQEGGREGVRLEGCDGR